MDSKVTIEGLDLISYISKVKLELSTLKAENEDLKKQRKRRCGKCNFYIFEPRSWKDPKALTQDKEN